MCTIISNLKNKRKRIILLPLDATIESKQFAGESDEEDHDRGHYRRQYAKNWQHQKRVKASLLRATDLANLAQMQSSSLHNVNTITSTTVSSGSTHQFQRKIASLSTDIAVLIFDHLKDDNKVICHQVLEKIVGHSLLKLSVPIFLQDMNLVKKLSRTLIVA